MRWRIAFIVSASTREMPKPDDPLLEATKSEPGLSDRTISPFTKKNNLSCTSGPPSEPPACRKLRLGLATTGDPRTVLPSKSWLRPNVYAEPWNSLVPLLVTVLTLAPVNPPWRTSNGATETCTCATASYGTGSALVCPPGAGSSKPNGLLKYDPSSEMLLYNQFLPEKL